MATKRKSVKVKKSPNHYLNLKSIKEFVSLYKRLPAKHQITTATAVISLTAASLILFKFISGPTLDLYEVTSTDPNYEISFPVESPHPYAYGTNPQAAIDSAEGTTIEFWVKPTQLTGHSIIFRSDNTNDQLIKIGLNTENKVVAYLTNLTETDPTKGVFHIESVNPIATNKWYHVAFVINKVGNEAFLYINGTKQNTQGISTKPYVYFHPENILLATDIFTESQEINTDLTFYGSLEDLHISAKPRYSSNFVPAPFNSLEPDIHTIGLWKFNQSSADLSENNFNLSLRYDPDYVLIDDEPTHAACVEYKCVQVPGMGDNQCSTEHPCATPIPTATPAPTPTPKPAEAAATPRPNVCENEAPRGQADIYQIDVSSSQATIYFAPATPPYTKYVVEFGENGQMQHSTSFDASNATGALSTTVSSLKANTTYTFRVQVFNGCKPGNWSNNLSAKTTASSQVRNSYYKNGPVAASSSKSTTTGSAKTTTAQKSPTTSLKKTTSTNTQAAAQSPTATTQPTPLPNTYTEPQPISIWQKVINFIFGKK